MLRGGRGCRGGGGETNLGPAQLGVGLLGGLHNFDDQWTRISMICRSMMFWLAWLVSAGVTLARAAATLSSLSLTSRETDRLRRLAGWVERGQDGRNRPAHSAPATGRIIWQGCHTQPAS